MGAGGGGGCGLTGWRAGALRVMIVEDEFIIALALRHQLEALGCQVCCVTDTAHAALECARSGLVDVVLMDVSLRAGGDGIEAARHLVREHGLPVIVISAYTDGHTRARALEAGACVVLGKPASEQELCAALDEALAP